MFMRPSMSIYMFTAEGQSDDDAKVASRSMAGRACGLSRLEFVPIRVGDGKEAVDLQAIFGYDQDFYKARQGGILFYWHNVRRCPRRNCSRTISYRGCKSDDDGCACTLAGADPTVLSGLHTGQWRRWHRRGGSSQRQPAKGELCLQRSPKDDTERNGNGVRKVCGQELLQ